MPPIFGGGHRRGGGTEKTDINSIKKLLKYCKAFVIPIVIALVFSVVSAITTIIGPNKISSLIDIISAGVYSLKGINMADFIRVCVQLIVLYSIGAVIGYLEQIIMAEVTQRVARKLRTDIDVKINCLPLKFFDGTTRGDVLSVVTNDIDVISQALDNTITELVNSVVLFEGVVIMMFVVNYILALVTIACSIFGFLLTFLILKKSQKYFNLRQQNLGEMNGYIEEIYTNHNIVKAFNGEGDANQNFKQINKKLYTNNWKSQAFSGLMSPLMGFTGNLSYVMIFVVGVSLALNNSAIISFGVIISFTMYARLFSQPLNSIAQSLSSVQQASAASKRVFNILESQQLPDESNKTKKLTRVKGDVEFRHVKFGYDKNKTIIKDFSAKLKHGWKVAIVGPTGAGKTTMVNLLMRFYEIDQGDILIDGVSIKDITRENVHDLFDMILQDTWLFNGTIRENLVYNKQNVTDKQLDKVTKAVGLKHFIKSLKNGYDTMLDESLSLSDGQKQQMTIARAMIKDSPLLILDEATSSVDTRTEQVIQNAMDKLTKNRTSFVIAHRLSTIRNADIILVMKDGDIIEQGNHAELLAKNGFYSELYNSQFQE